MNELKEIVNSLRSNIRAGTLNAEVVQVSTSTLAKHNYEYDATLFPSLPSNHQWTVPQPTQPESLAEALLWKMGKWKIYQSFVAHYGNPSSMPKKTDVVFYAFAKHLQSEANPIYDQHALRALWAIDANLSPQQASICRSLLAKRDGTWKSIANGSNTYAGYQLYVERIALLGNSSVSLGALDKLLMPLGQALKENTENVSEFVNLVGCAE